MISDDHRPPLQNDPGSDRAAVEPHTRRLLDRLASQQAPTMDEVPIEQSRKALKALMMELDRPAVSGVTSREDTIQGPNGPVPVTIHTPAGASGPLPVAVYLHGGGWARGDREMYDQMCRHFARAADCVVMNVEYRLAPEHRFPQGLEDSYAAVGWAHRHAGEIGGDPDRIAVLGDSAGANFAAAIALLARDEGIAIRLQGLIYPGVDLRRSDAYPSRRKYDDIYYFLDLQRLHWYIDHYLARPEDALDFRASPILAPSHENVAPAFVLTAELDPLYDEGAAYGDTLKKAGVAVDYRCYPGTVHGFLSFSKAIPAGLEAQDWVAARLRAALHS
ncbi:MAG: alpha/beta hydrolase [Alphaproteobacteria bacterium]|nr:MAG: alpha/beta hydrolase [Alphaproteobacteria bacterium]